ncbi:MAG TPA: cytochrome c oxidase subunit 3 [Pyrinomonadaceae bacterium]|jgi:cytochrome c oxidase subunit 3|nr:cytochrome c oxidase subunit 3 [Pyrinomonadaceae bacterium]
MEIGTVETIPEPEAEKRRRRTSLGGGSNTPSGGGRDPGGGPGPNDRETPQQDAFVPEKSRVLTAFLLVIVMMTFGGLTAAYVVIATNNTAEWQPFSLPIQVWISTAILLASSITYHLGKTRLDASERESAKKWLVATTVLGAAFISSQLLTWLELRNRGFYLSGNPYSGFFYILTAVHAIHVLGGIIALASVLLRVWYPTANDAEMLKRRSIAQVVGWYWHFMGGVWIVLFVLLGFWK